MWTLTYSIEGKRRVEFIPDYLLPEVQELAAQGRAYRDALSEIQGINARLLTLWRAQERGPRRLGKGRRLR